MPNGMPSPDVAIKDFFKDNYIFASLFNGYFFDGESIVVPEDLDIDETEYNETLNVHGKVEKVTRYRDCIRRSNIGQLVILGIEDQDKVHYAMPIRKMLYDVLTYTAELNKVNNVADKTRWTVDERLSRVAKGTKITPVITVVFYTGENAWDGPRSLHDMMDIDDRIRQYIPDYPLYVIDIGHDDTLHFNNEYLEDLRVMLTAIYSNKMDNNETEVSASMVALAGILAGDAKIYNSAKDLEGGEMKMCRVLEQRDAMLLEKHKQEFEELQMKMDETRSNLKEAQSELEEKRSELEEKKSELEEKRSELEEKKTELEEKKTELEEKKTELEEKKSELEKKNAEIAELKRLLNAKNC